MKRVMENKTDSVRANVARHFPSMAFAVIGICLLFAGCVASPDFGGDTKNSRTRDFPEAMARPPVQLSPGDTILIKFAYWPELDQEQQIRPDGMISLQLVGHIDVADMTVEALDHRLHQLYADKIKQPEITTIVLSYGNRRAYVGGEVARPGYVELTDKMTTLEAVMSAGGFETSSANLSDVVVIRHLKGQRYAKLVDLDQPVADSGSSLLIAPRDIIYVPRTRIAEVNQWVDQYISRVIPAPVWTYAVYSKR
jgi:protein involved in polysaccharide export with SLBB domain